MAYALGTFVSAPFSGGRVEGQVSEVRDGKVRISRATLARTGLILGNVWRREPQLSAISGPAPVKVGKVIVFPTPVPKTPETTAPAVKKPGRVVSFFRAVGRGIRRVAALFA